MLEKIEFKCETCDILMKSKRNYNDHLKTRKHKSNLAKLNKEKTGKNYACNDCGAVFSQRQGLYRHRKISCKELKSIVPIVPPQPLSTEPTPMQMLDKVVDVLKASVSTTGIQAEASVTNAETINKSMSIMSYAIKNFGGAPAMKSICDNTERALKLIEIQGEKDPNFNDEREEDIVIRHYEDKTLDEFFGEIFKAHCCKENPNDRFIWKTDIERLNFIVKFEGIQNKSEWVRDESGEKVKNTLLIPFFKHVREVLLSYMRELNKSIDDYDFEEMGSIMIKKSNCMKVANHIMTNDFYTKVLKYMGPSLKFDKLMMDKYEKKETPDPEFDEKNKFIYEYVLDALKGVDVSIFDNDFICRKCEEKITPVNLMVRNDVNEVLICIYYKSHQNKISLGEIEGIKNATDDIYCTLRRKLSIVRAIPMIICNNKLTEYELEILTNSKIRHVTLYKSTVRGEIMYLLEMRDVFKLSMSSKNKKVLSDGSDGSCEVPVKVRRMKASK